LCTSDPVLYQSFNSWRGLWRSATPSPPKLADDAVPVVSPLPPPPPPSDTPAVTADKRSPPQPQPVVVVTAAPPSPLPTTASAASEKKSVASEKKSVASETKSVASETKSAPSVTATTASTASTASKTPTTTTTKKITKTMTLESKEPPIRPIIVTDKRDTLDAQTPVVSASSLPAPAVAPLSTVCDLSESSVSGCEPPVWQYQPQAAAPVNRKQPPPFMQSTAAKSSGSNGRRPTNRVTTNCVLPARSETTASTAAAKGVKNKPSNLPSNEPTTASATKLPAADCNVYREYVNYPLVAPNPTPTADETKAKDTVNAVTAAFYALHTTGQEANRKRTQALTAAQQGVLASLQLPPSVSAKVDKLIA
uniref:Uncharacterized protein n=1 Tax=Plectus sambesii TaxID=2011161 RepID=A0A914VAY4_9BILA